MLALAFPGIAASGSLESAISGFQKCDFEGFYFAPWDPKQLGHRYFYERKLQPYSERDGLYYFKVQDAAFGLPVSEIIVPGTWNYHIVVFDVPVTKARQIF